MSRNRKTVIALVIVGLVALCATLGACQSFKYGPVGPLTDGETTNNGSLAVMQDGYVYYVNGMESTSSITKPTDNYFGKASVKGSIMKSKLNDDGTLSETAVVVPKMFHTTYADGGIYIYGQWIYYVSSSTKTDNQNKVLTSTLEFMRTTTDGSKTQSIAIVNGESTQYIVTAGALVYYDSADKKVMRVSFTDDKIGQADAICEEVSSVMFTKQSDAIFLTKSSEQKNVMANEVYMSVAGGDFVKLIDEKTFASATEGDVPYAEQMSVSPIRYDAATKTLYYTRTAQGGDRAAGTYGFTFDNVQEPKFDKTKEVKYANSALSGVTPIGAGLMTTAAAEVVIYKPITDLVSGSNNTVKTQAYSAAPTVLFFEGDYMYYLVSNKLMRCTGYDTEYPQEEKLSDVTVSSSWLAATRLNGYLYFINTDESSYLYRMQYSTFAFGNDLLKAQIVSGYEESDKTEDGLLPKFMTEADQKTYITAHPAEKD